MRAEEEGAELERQGLVTHVTDVTPKEEPGDPRAPTEALPVADQSMM